MTFALHTATMFTANGWGTMTPVWTELRIPFGPCEGSAMPTKSFRVPRIIQLVIVSYRGLNRVYTPLGWETHWGSLRVMVRTDILAVPSNSFSNLGPARYRFLCSKVMRNCTASSLIQTHQLRCAIELWHTIVGPLDPTFSHVPRGSGRTSTKKKEPGSGCHAKLRTAAYFLTPRGVLGH